jgi:3-isopropylmalate dehydrogenase
MLGDTPSGLAAGLIGGIGTTPPADFNDKHAMFQPRHGTAQHIMGRRLANPTA